MIREGRCMQPEEAWTFVWAPISLAISAAVLRGQGFDVKISDCTAEGIDKNLLNQKIREFNPDLIIINTGTPSIIDDIKVAECTKKISPSIKVGAIGIHISVLPDETFSLSKHLDYLIRREPEYIVKDLALNLRDQKPLEGIKGLSYRTDKKIIHNPDREFIKNLDDLPFPAWDLMDLDQYRMPFTDKRFLPINISRGCPYQCTFCNAKVYYGNKLRIRSSQKVADEIEWVKNKFGIDEFFFWSDSFTISNKHALEVADEIIKRDLKIKWVCNSRVDNINLKLLKRIKQAGCWMIGYGIESGNQQILNDCQKNVTLVQSIKAVKLAKKAGLQIAAHTIIGLPGETKETAKQTLKFLKNLNVDYAHFYCAVPFPGSKLYEEALEKGWIITNDWSRFSQADSIMDIGTIKAKDVVRLKTKSYIGYYLRPKQIYRTLRKIKSFSEFKNFLYMIKKFLIWVKSS